MYLYFYLIPALPWAKIKLRSLKLKATCNQSQFWFIFAVYTGSHCKKKDPGPLLSFSIPFHSSRELAYMKLGQVTAGRESFCQASLVRQHHIRRSKQTASSLRLSLPKLRGFYRFNSTDLCHG